MTTPSTASEREWASGLSAASDKDPDNDRKHETVSAHFQIYNPNIKQINI